MFCEMTLLEGSRGALLRWLRLTEQRENEVLGVWRPSGIQFITLRFVRVVFLDPIFDCSLLLLCCCGAIVLS